MTNAEKVYENVLTRTGEQKPRSIAEQMRDLLLRASPRNRRAWEEGSRISILDRMGGGPANKVPTCKYCNSHESSRRVEQFRSGYETQRATAVRSYGSI